MSHRFMPVSKHGHLVAGLILAALMLSGGCNDRDPLGENHLGPAVNRVEINPSAVALVPADTVRLTAHAYDSASGEVMGRVTVWASGDTTIARVSGTGLVTGMAEGTTSVTATVDGRAGTATINVAPVPEDPSVPAIVSNPVTSPAPAGTRSAALVAPVVYVSMPPGTFVEGIGANIRNLRTDSSVVAGMIAGGLDPVAVDATVGDTLEFTIVLIGGSPPVRFVRRVPAKSPPVIVRTDPPPGKRDVPLNAVMVVVFSEPVDPATVSATSIKLTRIGVAVSGQVTLAADGLSATFQSAAPLLPTAVYTLAVTTAVADLDGDPLEAPLTMTFTTAAPATQLAFSVQPATTGANQTMTPAVRVIALDASGNPTTGFTGTITLALGANAGGASLIGTTSVLAVAGIADFADLSMSQSGSGYTLVATASGLNGATSTAFDITSVSASPATQLVFSTQPTNTVMFYAMTPAVQVKALDASGNPATSFNGPIDIAIGVNPGGAWLSGNTSVVAVAGAASFANLAIVGVGSGYKLVAIADGLTSATSASFDVLPNVATQLVFEVQPKTTGAGVSLLPSVWVTALNAAGDTMNGFSGTISVALGANSGGASLSGTTSIAAGYDGAEFTDLRINQVGSGYTLVATANGLIGATSTAFDITPKSQIAYMDSDGDWEIYLMNADGSGITNLTDNPAVDGNPAWSADGARIAFTSDRDGNYEIYVMNADGSGATRVTNDLAWDTDASWSPDGTKIAFASDRGPSFDIYVMNPDGSGVTQLTNDLAREAEPSWSPDGSKIVFQSEYDIYVMNADGSGVTDLTNNLGGWQPAWSPDGTKIAFGSARPFVGIYVMNADGSGVTPLDLYMGGPVSWSPDGQKIACTVYGTGSDYDGSTTICVRNADGTGFATWITYRYGNASSPAWRP